MSGIPLTLKPFAFVQARLGSTRFPEKILQTIPVSNSIGSLDPKELTLLDHIHLRLNQILPKEQIIFLIPEKDYKLKEFLSKRSYLYFLGSEENVHSRFVLAANHFNAEHIIRLTGDNPFVDLVSIELLIESMFYHIGKDYCLAMSGLPLGMGVECFSKSALESEPKFGWQSHHKEHVSLHIKEDLQRFTVRRFDPPHLREDSISHSQKIRMTIDEENDLFLLREVASLCSKERFFFGAQEVLNLYAENKELFQKNQDVVQIKFDLPKEVKTNKTISIVYGDTKVFGTGHFERMKSISIFLQSYGFHVTMSDSENLSSSLQLWDKRDLLPNHPHTLCLDNKNENLGNLKIDNVDLLPHPSNFNNQSKVHFYSSPLIENFLDSNRKAEKELGLLLYLGNLELASVHLFLDKCFPRFLGWGFSNVHLITNLDTKDFSDSVFFPEELKKFSLNTKIHRRLFRSQFLSLLSRSKAFVSYFGIGLLEAMYLGKETAVFGISPVHNELGEFANQVFKIPYWGNLTETLSLSDPPEKTRCILKRDAEKPILAWIEKEWANL